MFAIILMSMVKKHHHLLYYKAKCQALLEIPKAKERVAAKIPPKIMHCQSSWHS